MIISLNWLKKFIDIDLPINKLVELIGARLVEIEKVIDLKAKYKDVLIVAVNSVKKLDNSDHLSVVKIDDGHAIGSIERDENGLIQVVCGASNIKAGQLVAWLPPKSIVPETYSKSEPFELGTRKLQGVMSNGMIASARELDLSDEHDGIMVINADVMPGTLFADVFEMDDFLLDIENKSLTHRPDCFGIVGFAREVAGIEGRAFETPKWLANQSLVFEDKRTNNVTLNISIDDTELSSRYLAVVMSGVDSTKQSPIQAQTYLSRVGVRPINAVVDVTNYLMMLTGQPLHAFDYDKLIALNDGKADIHVRAGRIKESLLLLDGRKIELTPDDIVIASGDTAIGLAGAMGGISTAIDKNTKNIIIESATFNLYNLRATQMRHGIFSEAITRFTKGQPAGLTAPVLSAAIGMMEDWADAKCISQVAESYPGKQHQSSIELSISLINDVLGSNYSYKNIVDSLQNVGFIVEKTKSELIKVTAPYWRADINIPEDIIEEIGRLNGFDNIALALPTRDFTAVREDDFDSFRTNIRKILVRAGANEVLTYSFVHGDVLQKVGQDVKNSYRITNSISPDLQYYRQSLTPSLLELVHPNIKQGNDSFALFEINKTHQKIDGLTKEKVPVEVDMTSFVVASKDKLSGAAYYQAKRFLDFLCKSLGIEISYKPIAKDLTDSVGAPFEYRRSALIIDQKTGSNIGIIGEYKKSVTRGFKLPESVSGFEINTRSLFETTRSNLYNPLSRYPTSERDICFQVKESVLYDQIIDAVNAALKTVKLETSVCPVDIYQSLNSKTKNITIRVKMVAHDHTLTNDELNDVVGQITKSVKSSTQAIVI